MDAHARWVLNTWGESLGSSRVLTNTKTDRQDREEHALFEDDVVPEGENLSLQIRSFHQFPSKGREEMKPVGHRDSRTHGLAAARAQSP